MREAHGLVRPSTERDCFCSGGDGGEEVEFWNLAGTATEVGAGAGVGWC